MDRAAKRELVSTLNDVFKTSGVVVVAHYAGLTVADMQKLRKQMKQVGGHVKVTLTDGKIAFDVSGPNAAQVKAVEAQTAD